MLLRLEVIHDGGIVVHTLISERVWGATNAMVVFTYQAGWYSTTEPLFSFLQVDTCSERVSRFILLTWQALWKNG